MAQLAVVQFFSWFGLFAMWIYTTAAVTSNVYGTTDPRRSPTMKGRLGWGMFAVYNGVAALVAFLLPELAGDQPQNCSPDLSGARRARPCVYLPCNGP